jgi:hypothetical protein
MKSHVIIITILLIGNTTLSAGLKLPEGWREPLNNEITDNIYMGRDKHPNKYLAAEADFNEDGIIDTAQLFVNDSINKMGLFVLISKQGNFERILLDQIDDKSSVGVMGLSVVEPGEYKTACGKGYWKCEEGEPEKLVLKRPAINYFKFESANSFFVWDEKKMAFKRIWISD